MTTNQHPGGVAGRVIDRFIEKCLHPSHDTHDFSMGQRVGAEAMQYALSREARAILAEDPDKHWDEVFSGVGNRIDLEEPSLTDAEKQIWHWAQEYMAARMGLTLTEPDTGGDGGCGMPYGVFGEGEPDND